MAGPFVFGHQIPIRMGNSDEWTMVQLQGVMEPASAVVPGAEIGQLSFLAGDKVQLRIGKQMLDGTLVALKKPQAVLSKGPRAEGGTCFTVVGVIRRKAVFAHRPNPILTPRAAPQQSAENGLSASRSKRPRATSEST